MINFTGLFPVFIAIAVVLTVMLSELIKSIDKKNVLKGYRVYVPLVISFGIAWLLRIGDFFIPEQVWFWWAAIFGISVFAFEAILKKIKASFEENG